MHSFVTYYLDINIVWQATFISPDSGDAQRDRRYVSRSHREEL